MQIVVIAGGITQTEFQDKQIAEGVRAQFVTTISEAKAGADAYFYLLEEEDLVKDMEQIKSLAAPVFVNAVSTTLNDLPSNAIRVCAWNGFLLQQTIEISAAPENIEKAKQVFDQLKWQFRQVPDIVGMIAPRTTALLINEAYLLADDNPANKKEIDVAIKLAANFRNGPFELAEKIGLQKVFTLLKHLAELDARYTPAPFLQKEISDLGATS
jgi:3-hydroxybutyryl-CoA dehydrogenase